MQNEFERRRGWGWCHLGIITCPRRRDRDHPHPAHPRLISCELGTSSTEGMCQDLPLEAETPLNPALAALWKWHRAAAPAKGRAAGAAFHHPHSAVRPPTSTICSSPAAAPLSAGSCKSRQEFWNLQSLILTCRRAWQRAPRREQGKCGQINYLPEAS